MQVIPKSGDWQVVTNKQVFKSEPENQCNRYHTACRILEQHPHHFSWQDGLALLHEVAQVKQPYQFDGQKRIISTEWSTVFDLNRKTVFLSRSLDYKRIFQLTLHDRDFYAQTDQAEQ